jgi:biotin carboxyl carrier protein
MKFELFSGGRKVDVEVTPQGEDFGVAFDGKKFAIRLEKGSTADEFLALFDDDELRVTLEEETETTLKLGIDGSMVSVGRAQAQMQSGVSTPDETPHGTGEKDALTSPLYGKIVSVDVKAGEGVDTGQSLLVVESMKMESVIRADGKHTVKEVLVKEGEGVTKGQVLMRFTPGEG